jgi:hypothetical protein
MTTEEAEKRLNDLIEECQRQAEQDRQRQDYPRKRDSGRGREMLEELASRAH